MKEKGEFAVMNDKELNIAIGKRIRDIREKQNKTREQVAEQANISSQFLFEIETGKKSMTARTIINLAKTLSVSTDFLLLGSSPTSVMLEGLPQTYQQLANEFLSVFAKGASSIDSK